jgi:transcription termination/antitermination protein NusG
VSTSDEKSVATELHWYAIRVQSNKEDSVKRNLDRKIELRGFQEKIKEVVVPTEKVAEIRNGKKRLRAVKTYPGYVLANMLMDEDTWVFVRETAGVGDFVGASAMPARGGAATPKPFPLRPEEVQKIFGASTTEAGGGAKIKINFQTGDKVKIKEGPFENFDGVVDDINEQKGIVRVIVTIFGRATPVELQYWQVESL